ncbi:LysE family translocator [Roseibium sp. RKSG952]|uniref:LysE family translocator n=1 Tax=Roseibium sp. RKSG952 TaxID=2529384 RepID=UPI0012BC96C8|nr:LysE family translocator [Roseibium sp. RKSG952]MTH96675.1 LysE family translocator [Roseibium sp. RKSG952]
MPSFLPDLAVIATFTAAAAVLTITPGPDMALFMSKTLTQGRKAGSVAVMGAASGVVVHSLFAALGISALLAASATAFSILKYAGAAYLVYMAVQAIRNGSALSLDAAPGRKERLSRIWLQGVTINLLNPKIVLFFVTFLPQFVSASDPFAAQKLLFLGFYFILLAVPSCLLMVFFAGSFARFLKSSPRAMRLFDWTFAGVMGAFALKLLAAQAAAR